MNFTTLYNCAQACTSTDHTSYGHLVWLNSTFHHSNKNLKRFACWPVLFVTSNHTIPRYSVSFSHSVEHLLRTIHITTLCIHINKCRPHINIGNESRLGQRSMDLVISKGVSCGHFVEQDAGGVKVAAFSVNIDEPVVDKDFVTERGFDNAGVNGTDVGGELGFVAGIQQLCKW
ncbi:hypothetical protein MIMGU_mgv1a014949mg [Erythranthe guttata]|uniref:Uncharacterized protein n=1 Tax=Erythranthe guttata TaxID=4155 RepID=A0A022Q7Z9_ERYGU|nr:hypothetical protein MIMGU_mgv1a014949mg [Erythranthe guttata]